MSKQEAERTKTWHLGKYKWLGAAGLPTVMASDRACHVSEPGNLFQPVVLPWAGLICSSGSPCLGCGAPGEFERLGVKRTLVFMTILVPGPVALHPPDRVEVTGMGENAKVAHSFRKPV